MLVQFRFNNYRSFKGDTTLSLVAAPTISRDKASVVPVWEDMSLLKTVAVYGANASGKTKLFLAFYFMLRMVSELAKNNKSNWQELYMPFVLDQESSESDSSFEVCYIDEGVLYRYGYTIDAHSVKEEWLFRQKDKKETVVFYRVGDNIMHYSKTYIKKDVVDFLLKQKMLREDTLLLTVLLTWNNTMAKKVVGFFFYTNVLSATSDFSRFSIKSLDTAMKESIVRFMQSADINIEDMSVREMEVEKLPDEVKMYMSPQQRKEKVVVDGINTLHKVYDNNGLMSSFIRFSLEQDESYGTYRLFSLSAPLIDTLKYGKVLFVDEIDNGLHSELLKAIVSLFQSSEANPHNAQLIINTHNVGLLEDANLFKQDQVYVTEKDRFGEARLTPLLKYAIKGDETLGELYRDGRLGGVPYLAQFMQCVIDSVKE